MTYSNSCSRPGQ